jgi:hypothetical protein
LTQDNADGFTDDAVYVMAYADAIMLSAPSTKRKLDLRMPISIGNLNRAIATASNSYYAHVACPAEPDRIQSIRCDMWKHLMCQKRIILCFAIGERA